MNDEDEKFESLPLDARGHSFNLLGNPETVRVHTSYGIRSVHSPHLFNCRLCDFRPDFEITDTVTAREECPHPDGLTTVTEVAFRSGQVIVSDDLRTAYDWDEHKLGFAGYNSSLGRHQAIQHMASLGCAFGYVGNSGPYVFHTGEGTYSIGCLRYSEDEKVCPDGWREVAWICTDLWAYSIVDHADWTAKSEAWVVEGVDEAERKKRHERYTYLKDKAAVVDIKPGTYRFTCHSAEKDFDTHADGAVFATFERVSD